MGVSMFLIPDSLVQQVWPPACLERATLLLPAGDHIRDIRAVVQCPAGLVTAKQQIDKETPVALAPRKLRWAKPPQGVEQLDAELHRAQR